MSELTTRDATGNFIAADSNRAKAFIWNNEFEQGMLLNQSGAEKEFKLGTVLGRLAANGKLIPMSSDSADSVAAVIGVHTLTITANPGDGDKITIGAAEYEFVTTPATGKVTIGGSITDTVTALEALADDDATLAADFTIAASGATITYTQKVGGIGAIPALIVTPVPSTGTLAANIATTTVGSLVQPDGAQYPVGVLAETITLAIGAEANINYCISGTVNESMVILAAGDTLDTVIEYKRIRDRIKSDTKGIRLEAVTDDTFYDN